jgi:transposase InsO family protein
MSANQASFPITAMARVLGVSKAGYYAWLQRPPSAHATADVALLKRIKTVHASSRQTYGAPRVHADLRRQGEKHSRKRIARLMREAGLVGASHRHGGPTTTRRNKDDRPAPDLVARDFSAAGPNQLWVADITYVPTMAGFLYLAVVLDAWSRKIVGWAMANHLRAELVLDAMEMAVGQRRPKDVTTRAANIPRWHSASGAARQVFDPQWARSGMPTTTQWPRASSPPSRPSCSAAAGSHPRPRRRWPASATSRVGTIRCGCIRAWDTARH